MTPTQRRGRSLVESVRGCDDEEDPDEPAAIVDAAKDLGEDSEGLDLRGDEGLDLRGDELDAGDELRSGEDVLVNVPSDRSDANLCADLVLAINKTHSNLFIHKSRN